MRVGLAFFLEKKGGLGFLNIIFKNSFKNNIKIHSSTPFNITKLIMYLTKFQEADGCSEGNFRGNSRQNLGNFRFEARPKLKYFCDWSIEQGQNFEPIKIQNLSKSGREFLVLVQVCCLLLVAKWLKSKDFIVQTLNILKVSSTQVRIKTRRTAQETG